MTASIIEKLTILQAAIILPVSIEGALKKLTTIIIVTTQNKNVRNNTEPLKYTSLICFLFIGCTPFALRISLAHRLFIFIGVFKS